MQNENKFFPEIQGRFGFGLMRLPMNGEDVDEAQTAAMADRLMAAGFNYFDTAHGYISGKSETAFREAVAKRYPRDAYQITDKLSGGFFKSEADILPLFETQLKACGLDYFDFYLMHALGAENLQHFIDCNAFKTAFALKKQGKVRHVGFSFHDSAEVLDRILTDYPQFEVVQLQLNYLDWEDENVQSRKCYEVCVKHKKPVIVMEPVKGGSLVHMIPAAEAALDRLRAETGGGNSNAGYALRYVLGLENVMMVISGMSDLSQMDDNLSVVSDFRPLGDRERAALGEVVAAFDALDLIRCTACRYCTDGCPMEIRIPDLFSQYNRKLKFDSPWAKRRYDELTADGHAPADCLACGQCEGVCPQHLPVIGLLQKCAETFR